MGEASVRCDGITHLIDGVSLVQDGSGEELRKVVPLILNQGKQSINDEELTAQAHTNKHVFTCYRTGSISHKP